MGRFISPDTLVPDPTNPQSFNRYSYVLNSPVNYMDPTGHRECAAICDGEVPSWDTYQDAAWEGTWDLEQQATNSARAENAVEALKGVVGFLWEPADWAFAFSDGLQWYDAFGMLPVVPAVVGTHLDEFVPLAKPIVVGENMERVQEYADSIGGSTIADFVENWSMEANALWAQRMVDEGRQIIDIGPDFARREQRALRGVDPASAAYELERQIFSGYEGVQKAFQRFGRFLGGVAGLDY